MARDVPQHGAVPRLSVALTHAVGTLTLDMKFNLAEPWTILFGPSGAGKTTVLRAIAGLIHPRSARIVVEWLDAHGEQRKDVLVDTDAGRFVPSHLRAIPLAAQRAGLFPHRTVREQIGYGMSLDRAGQSLTEKTDQICALFRIAHLRDKLPAMLSGGEAQRVNLARAAAAATGLLLLDEPFTGLDATLRSEMMDDLRRWAAERKLCVLSVTHDIAEAFQLDAEVVKISEGRVVHQGSAALVLAEERMRLLRLLGGEGLPERSDEPYLSG